MVEKEFEFSDCEDEICEVCGCIIYDFSPEVDLCEGCWIDRESSLTDRTYDEERDRRAGF